MVTNCCCRIDLDQRAPQCNGALGIRRHPGIEQLPQWYQSWLWSLPLIVATVTLHVFGTRNRSDGFRRLHLARTQGWNTAGFSVVFALVIGDHLIAGYGPARSRSGRVGRRVSLAGCASGSEVGDAVSLSAMTTYGHASLYLEPHWQMMGAIKSLNGVLLFGVTTATLFQLSKAYREWATAGADTRACHQLASVGAPAYQYWAGKSRLPHSVANRRQVIRNQFRCGDFCSLLGG